MAIPAGAQSQSAVAATAGKTTQSRARHFLEGATTIASTLQSSECASQKERGGGDGAGAGTDRLRLGHRLPDQRAGQAQETRTRPASGKARTTIHTQPAQEISEENQIAFKE